MTTIMIVSAGKSFMGIAASPVSLVMLIFLVTTVVSALGQGANDSQKNILTNFTDEPLKVVPSAASSENDFDFLQGTWIVHNRKLKVRLNKSTDWEEFKSTIEMSKALLGMGNVEHYNAELKGKPFEGLAVRLFNRGTRLWTIYWVDSNGGVMDQHPVSGSFENRVGKFYAKDEFNGKKIIILYQWDATHPERPVWSQAFSDDNGKTWEWNWTMTLSKLK